MNKHWEVFPLKILVTGGAGYIGSHTCISLLEAGYDIVVLDNFSNSKLSALKRVMEITGKEFPVYPVDLLDKDKVEEVFSRENVDAVIHFAGLKAVGESVSVPLRYYHNNLTGTFVLCEAMLAHGVSHIVFSSSATVYGMQEKVPLVEDMPMMPINPYGRTKWMIEEVLKDCAVAHPDWSVALLRYFNPVGAHESGKIGEDPNGIPNNLLPFVSQVAVGKLAELTVYGDDYPTPDGTCIRDYIHVMDLAVGHVKALDYIMDHQGVEAFNLGTGKGSSVLEVVAAFEQAANRSLPKRIGPRRPGDAPVSYADANKANRILNWKAQRDLLQMCTDAWRWQSANPNGFPEE